MRKLGELWRRDQMAAAKAATAVGYVLAAELRACGVDLSFTPVLDLDYGESGVIGDRAFDRDPRVVAFLAKSLNHGLLLTGMANCGKHFPGHGFVKADSHTEVPVDTRDLAEIMHEDAAPYGWLGMSLSAVMPAHVIYPKVDSHPAGFSRKWLNILRNDLGFDGVIFSDDLSMEGASVAGSVVDGAQLALAAGCDMVLVCNSPDKADQLLAGLNPRKDAAAARSVERIRSMMPRMPAKNWDLLQNDTYYRDAKRLIETLQ
jgi:beta-N-acetylhexosaminidase